MCRYANVVMAQSNKSFSRLLISESANLLIDFMPSVSDVHRGNSRALRSYGG